MTWASTQTGTRHLLIPSDGDAAAAADTVGSAISIRTRRPSLSTAYSSSSSISPACALIFSTSSPCSAQTSSMKSSRHPISRPSGGRRAPRCAAPSLDFGPKAGPRRDHRLFAELSLLDRMLSFDPRTSLEAWTGPSRARHDFQRGRDDSLRLRAAPSPPAGRARDHESRCISTAASTSAWVALEGEAPNAANHERWYRSPAGETLTRRRSRTTPDLRIRLSASRALRSSAVHRTRTRAGMRSTTIFSALPCADLVGGVSASRSDCRHIRSGPQRRSASGLGFAARPND